MKLAENEFRYMNPGASEALVIPITLQGVISDEDRKLNFIENIKLDIPWVDNCQANNDTAIICGAAPSLIDNISEIRKTNGAIFACNTAAQVLVEHGVSVDYQVLLDPQELLIDEFCKDAEYHLIASIVTPEIFRLSKNPILWHPFFQWIMDYLENYEREFCYIGGGVSVSTFALSLAYTLGYRKFVLYGVDSSFRDGITHANGRHIKDEDGSRIKVEVEDFGKTYQTTYDMKQQVLVFLQLFKLMESEGCSITVKGTGLLPDAWKASRIFEAP